MVLVRRRPRSGPSPSPYFYSPALPSAVVLLRRPSPLRKSAVLIPCAYSLSLSAALGPCPYLLSLPAAVVGNFGWRSAILKEPEVKNLASILLFRLPDLRILQSKKHR